MPNDRQYEVVYTIHEVPDIPETVRFNSWPEARSFEREHSHVLRTCDIQPVIKFNRAIVG